MPRPLLWTDVPLHSAAWDALRPHVALSGPTVSADDAASPGFAFEEADAAIVGTRRQYGPEQFAAAARLQVIARTGIGYDNVDVAAATAVGVCAVNTPDAPTESTAEFAVGLMFAVARRITVADRNSKAGEWKFDASLVGFDLAGKTLGLVGFGRIARRVAEMARAIRMTVCAFDPFVEAGAMAGQGVEPCAGLPDLLARSQVLSLHAPVTPATRGLLGTEQLALLPPGAVVINTARGPLVDEGALLAALERGHLAGAGIDVWVVEPAAPDHPLLRHPRVVATPHMASFTEEGRRRSHVAAAHLVLGTLRGEKPATLLNPSVWENRRR